MNIEAPTGEQLSQLLVIISNKESPYTILFPFLHMSTTFSVLKDMVWQRAAFMGLNERLGRSNHYHWEFVNKDGDIDTILIMDEATKSLKDINWSVELDAESDNRPNGRVYTTSSPLSVLRLVKTPDADLHENQMKMNKIIGVNMERQSFGVEARALATAVADHKLAWVRKYNAATPVDRLLMKYPPNLVETPFHPSNGKQKVLLKMQVSKTHQTIQSIGVNDSAQKVIELLLGIYTERKQSTDGTDEPMDTANYILKVVGRKQYLYGDTVVCRQKDIRFYLECQRNVSFPVLALIRIPKPSALPEPRKQLVLVQSPSNLGGKSAKDNPQDGEENGQSHTVIYNQLLLQISAEVSTQLNFTTAKEMHLLAGLCHGNSFLNPCEPIRLIPRRVTDFSSSSSNTSSTSTVWIPEYADQVAVFREIAVSDIPRSTRLCLALVSCSPTSVTHHGWANLPLFDSSSRLSVGRHSLGLWAADDYCGRRRDALDAPCDGQNILDSKVNRERLCRPLGIPGSNPEAGCPFVKLQLVAECVGGDEYTAMALPSLFYPDEAKMMEIAASVNEPNSPLDELAEMRLQQLARSDVLQDMAEQDKEFLWKQRFDLMAYPWCLPRLHQCVRWNDSNSVALYHSLVKGWPHDKDPLSAGYFLELLHHNFPDKLTREYAVERGLTKLEDEMIEAFMPQIIQCLKYESYIDSALAKMVLKRASTNAEVGNALYYHMRAEMRQSASVEQRFAHLLNVYFLSSLERVDALYRVSEAIDRLFLIQRRLQKDCDSVKREFQDRLVQWNQTFNDLRNPLFVDTKLCRLQAKTCVVFDSKMRPLLMRWNSADVEDVNLPRHGVIFKSGDDLRQDVLTVQILSIMEMVWERERLPLRLYPYRVLSLGPREGFIEAIWEAETLSSIRARSSASGNNYLYLWLQQKCEERRGDFKQTVEQFRMTCAAYCVAIYVLGIGDRHNDNIMLTQSGILYHIDFGHFLGNYKRFKRFNIAREFVSFLLVEEFKFVITNGDRDEDALKDFRRVCVQAFMSLRNHANLILTLFLNMTDIGMPELSSPDNLEFLRSRLSLEKTDKEAEELFMQRMAEDDTFFQKLTVRMNWNFHDMAHKK